MKEGETVYHSVLFDVKFHFKVIETRSRKKALFSGT